MDNSLFLFEKTFEGVPQMRVFTDLKSSKRFSIDAYKKAKIILGVLDKIRHENMKKNVGWADEWLIKANLNIKKSGLKEWFAGRASIPLYAINALTEFAQPDDFLAIKENCDYFCTKTSSPAKFPNEISLELAWIVAAMLCDGHIGHNWGGIVFEVGDSGLANAFCDFFSKAFQIKLKNPHLINRIGRKRTYRVSIHNAPIELFLNKAFQIPIGYKCNIIKVPSVIKKANLEIKRAFLKGVFDTDGGKRGGGLGLTTLSGQFRDGVSELLKEFNIYAKNDFWVNKRYKKKCYGFRFKLDGNSMFLSRQQPSCA